MKKNKNIDFIADSLENSTRTRLRFFGAITDLFCIPLGWTFLFIKYRDKNKIADIKIKRYDNSYAVVGRTIILQAFLLILGLLCLGLIIAGIVGTVKNT